ncbi:MAG: PorP/SprF family type IX secretion system membrane protein [Bacteroidota bacterium]
MRSTFTFILLLVAAACYAQQRPLVTQYNQNNFLLNPALSGLNYGSEFRMGNRAQYNSTLESPPQSFYMTANFSLRAKEVPESFGLPVRGKGAEQVLKLRKAAKERDKGYANHHGLGIVFLYDNMAALSSNSFQVTYAYHYAIRPDLQLSAGAGLGFTTYALNQNMLRPEEFGDAALQGIASIILPEVSAGVWLTGKNYFLGLAGQQLAPSDWSTADKAADLQNTVYPHIYLTGGYKVNATKELALIPSVMVRQTKTASLANDVTLTARYNEKYWLGGTFRIGTGISAQAGIYLLPNVLLGYSYDHTTTSLMLQSFGTHEIVVGYNVRGLMHHKIAPGKFWN